MPDLIDALAELPGTAQVLDRPAGDPQPFTRVRLPGAVVELPERGEDAPLFPHDEGRKFEAWWREGFEAAVHSGDRDALALILALALKNGLA